MLNVVGVLNGAAALGFGDGPSHRIGEIVGIENRHALDVASSPADGLNQGALGPQKALLIGIKNRH